MFLALINEKKDKFNFKFKVYIGGEHRGTSSYLLSSTRFPAVFICNELARM